MQLDDVNIGKASPLHEIYQMQKSFHTMVENLKEFRSFLPSTILDRFDKKIALEEEEEELAEARRKSTLSQLDSIKSMERDRSIHSIPSQGSDFGKSMQAIGSGEWGKSTQSIVSTERQSKYSKGSFGSSEGSDSRIRKYSAKKLSLGITERNITVMYISIRNFNELFQTVPPEEVVKNHGMLLESLNTLISTSRGTFKTLRANEFMASWNTNRRLSLHEKAACLCAHEIVKKVKEVNKKAIVGIGIACGKGFFGIMGTQRFREFLIISEAIEEAQALCRQNQYLNTEILVSDNVQKQIKNWFVMRPVDSVQLNLLDTKVQTNVYELFEEIAITTGLHEMSANI